MRKKIISAMLALCMAGSLLTGCGTSADAEKSYYRKMVYVKTG